MEHPITQRCCNAVMPLHRRRRRRSPHYNYFFYKTMENKGFYSI